MGQKQSLTLRERIKIVLSSRPHLTYSSAELLGELNRDHTQTKVESGALAALLGKMAGREEVFKHGRGQWQWNPEYENRITRMRQAVTSHIADGKSAVISTGRGWVPTEPVFTTPDPRDRIQHWKSIVGRVQKLTAFGYFDEHDVEVMMEVYTSAGWEPKAKS